MWPLSYMAETATIWVTVLIAVNRYIIVCLPLRASQWCTLSKVKIQLAVVLVLVILYNIPEIVRRRSHLAEQLYVVRGICCIHGATFVSAMLLCLRQSFAHYSDVVFADVYPVGVDRSSDKSDDGSWSYAGGDAASPQPAGQQYDVCSRNCRHRVHHLQNAAYHLEVGGAPELVVFSNILLYGYDVLYASHPQLGSKFRYIYSH